MATEERTGEPILKIRHLTKEFQLKSGLPFVKGPVLHAVTDVNLDLYEGETLGIIGESGCGKSTLGRTVTMLHKATSGTVEFEGRNIFELKGKELTDLRKDVQMVFQDPFSSLDPRLTCGDLIAEPLIVHGLMPDKKERDAFVLSLMKEVGLDVQHVNRFPHLGHVVELCAADQIYENPMHPYTKALLSAIPPESPFQKKERIVLQGEIPSPIGDQVGCPLAGRCPYCTDRCKTELPELKDRGDRHQVACFLYE